MRVARPAIIGWALAAAVTFSPHLVASDGAPDEAAAEEDHVVALTTATFDETLKSNDRVLVEFYAPWCGHCKKLEPEYRQAASEMRKEGLKTVLAKVDATVESELGQKYEIKGYPTLKYFVKGQAPKEYDGGRDAAGLKRWLAKRELPAVQTLEAEKVADFLKGTAEGEFAFVAKVVKKSARAKAYAAAVEAQLMDLEDVKMRFGVVHLPKGADPKADATLTMHRPGFKEPDTESLAFDGKWTEGAIAKWAKISTYPVLGAKYDVTRYAADAAEAIGREGSVVVMLHAGDGDKDQLKATARAAILPLATAEPKWLFTAAPLEDMPPPRQENFGLDRSPQTTAIVFHGSKRYVLSGGSDAILAPGALKAHLEAVKAKKAKPFFRSAAAPDPPVEEGVTVLTGDTFEKYVMDPKKDVFVEFYAPWCGHCKQLAPEWAGVAQKAKESGWEERGVVIAKMDSTENECEEEVSGYPKLVLYPAVKSDKKFRSKQVYSGAREKDSLVDFLLENAKSLEGVEEPAAGGGKKRKPPMVERDLERKRKAKKEL